MATGTFLTMDKTRPGAYINYRAPEKPSALGDSRGVMTVALPLSWGEPGSIITLTNEDLASGASLRKVGFVASQAGSLLFRLALESAHTALIYRLDSGGAAATKTLGNSSRRRATPGPSATGFQCRSRPSIRCSRSQPTWISSRSTGRSSRISQGLWAMRT